MYVSSSQQTVNNETQTAAHWATKITADSLQNEFELMGIEKNMNWN